MQEPFVRHSFLFLLKYDKILFTPKGLSKKSNLEYREFLVTLGVVGKLLDKEKGLDKSIVSKAIVLVIILLAIVAPIVLLWKYLAPLGTEVTFRYDSATGKGFIRGLQPGPNVVRVFQQGRRFAALRKTSASFEVQLPPAPKGFKKAVVKVRFKNDKQAKFFIGLKDRPKKHYLTKPMDNKILNFLNWNVVGGDNLTLFQRERVFKDVQEFIATPPKDAVIASYFLDEDQLKLNPVVPKDYMKDERGLLIDQALRGPHILYTYIKNEPLDFIIEKQDLNRKQGADPLRVSVYRGDTLVLSRTIVDDGTVTDSGQMVNPQALSLQAQLREGTYTIKLSCSKDVIIKQIYTKQHLLVFKNKLFLAGNEGTQKATKIEPIAVFTDSRTVRVEAFDKDGLQELLIDDQRLLVSEPGYRYRVVLQPGIKKIELQRGGVIIRGPGFFSFSRESFFEPVFPRIIEFDEEESLDYVDYIITSYQLPSEDDGWLINQQTFDLSRAYIEKDGVLRFKLSSPGLNRKENQILIDYVEVTLKKPSIFASSQ